MNARLEKALNTNGSHNILPFTWAITGIDVEKTIEQMRIIKSCGIDSVCIESRTFHDFAGETWWPFIESIMQEARKTGMRVWILDDTHFPTGCAAGWIEKKYPERRRLHLAEFHVDVIGPRRIEMRMNPFSKEDELLGVVAVKRSGYKEELLPEVISVPANPGDRYVSFIAPEGAWRVFQLWLTHEGASTPTPYINMLDPDSVQVLVDAVYEAHYEHIGEYFGKEMAGFFSDEPCFGNTFITKRVVMNHTHNHNKTVGMPGLALPWRKGLETMLSEKLGKPAVEYLPLLWFDGEGMSEMREVYMDTVSALYGEHFAGKLGNWCRAHGVEYIGHIIEDNNSHCRLGGSPGHYFRSMEGQDMAGLDVVLTQIVPGFIHTDHNASVSTKSVEPLFYSFTLPKLGPSLAHIRPHMKNRCMCEVFGAYGWAMDIPTMKWLLDHFLVNGTNRFVPHAFSPLYPYADCPPHFHGGGENPQFEDFAHMMRYLGKMTALLEGSRVTKAAVLYHAEMEWSGKPFMLNDEIACALTEAQIDFDIVPSEDLVGANVVNGVWKNGNGEYGMLIVPGAQYLPVHIIESVNRLSDAGLSVVQANTKTPGLLAETVALNDVVRCVESMGLREIKPDKECPYLRALHIKAEDADVFMFFNESVTDAVDTTLQLPVNGAYTLIDILGERTESGIAEEGKLRLSLSPYESVVYVFDGTCASAEENKSYALDVLDAKWQIAAADCDKMDDYRIIAENASLRTIEKDIEDFAGRVRYTAKITDPGNIRKIVLENVGDTALVTINGQSAGRRICAPYAFNTDGMWKDGENEICIYVSTTLGKKQWDPFSSYLATNPPGLDGEIRIYR